MKIDVHNTSIGSSSWHCAEQKIRTQMNECERYVAATGSFNENDREITWEENINKLVPSLGLLTSQLTVNDGLSCYELKYPKLCKTSFAVIIL